MCGKHMRNIQRMNKIIEIHAGATRAGGKRLNNIYFLNLTWLTAKLESSVFFLSHFFHKNKGDIKMRNEA